LYLRRVRQRDGYRYLLRDSHWENGSWKCRNLFDLGESPEGFIHYPGGNGFYFSSEVEDALFSQGVKYSAEDLEDAFLPFIKPHIQRVIGGFRRNGSSDSRWRNFSASELLSLQNALHSFDKRRLHFLRCGRVNIGSLDGRPWKFLNVLLGKCRDEIEHVLESMERQLRPQEMRAYLYTALHLQKYFPRRLTRHHPVALDPEEVDERFLQELCELNDDKSFFKGVARNAPGKLHRYLTKYVILYFDNDFEQENGWAEFARQFTWGAQGFSRSAGKASLSIDEACQRLGLTTSDFDRMGRAELTKHYRLQAKKLHPDRGGDHEEFIRMAEAYESLLLKS